MFTSSDSVSAVKIRKKQWEIWIQRDCLFLHLSCYHYNLILLANQNEAP